MSFVLTSSNELLLSMIDISQSDYNLILTAIGYPAVKESDLEITKADILEYIVKPCVRQYWKWFPKTLIESKYVSASVAVFPFPNKDTFGVLDCRMNPYNTDYGRSSSPFLNAINYHEGHHRMYGTPYDYGMTEAELSKRAWDISRASYLRAVNIEVDRNNREVRIFTNDIGEVIITWAMISESFEDIPIKAKDEVIQLCQCYLLRFMADLRGQISQDDSGTSFDISGFNDRADALEDKVMTAWKGRSKGTIARG